jgi:catechol-2,3-dioxygenase
VLIGPAMMASPTVPAVIDPRTHVQFVALRVRSAAGVARLYEDAIGLHRLPDGAELGDVVLGDSDGRPLVVLHESRGAPPPPRRAAGLFHTAIRFGSRAELAAALRRVLQAGFRLTGASDHGVSKSLYGRDPDGNEFEVMWQVPREAWGEFADQATVMPLDLDAELARWGSGTTVQ